jgi:hypothetical protein
MRRFALFVFLVVVLAAIPAAMASHTMGHRYLVHGRLIGADGMPVQKKDILIELHDKDGMLSSITTTTDCQGDFDSWKGRVATRATKAGDGQGEIEDVPAAPDGSRPAYVNFHFHDSHLSNQLSFKLSLGNESWKAGFDSSHRQSVVLHQMAQSYPATCGDFDLFKRTLTVRVFISTTAEMATGETAVKPRHVDVTFKGANASGPTNFVSTFIGELTNQSFARGDTVHLEGTDIGSRTVKLDGNAAKFHRVTALYVIGLNPGTALSDFKYVGIGIVVIGLLVGLWMGGNRLRDKLAEKRLRETSTRRRFRRERQP